MAKRKQLSHSAREQYKNCPRAFMLGRELRLEPREKKNSLNMGTAFALAIEHGDPTLAEKGYREGLPNDAVLNFQQDTEVAVAELIAELYLERYGAHDNQYVPHPEFDFTSPVVGPGKLDNVLVTADGSRRIGVECKLFTKGMFWNDTSIKVLAIDDQVTAYFYAMREMGLPLDHLRYRVQFKPGIKPDSRKAYKDSAGKVTAKGESIKDYIARLRQRIADEPEYAFEEHILFRDDAELDRFGEEAAEVNAHVALSRRRGAWPKNTKSCTMFGGCAFLPICRNEPGAMMEFRKRKEPIKLTKPQRRVLMALRDSFTGSVVPAMLAKQAMTTGAGLAKTLKALEARELVVAFADYTDGMLLYQLTDKGREATGG